MNAIRQCERGDCPIGPITVAGVITRVIFNRRGDGGRAIFYMLSDAAGDDAEGVATPVAVSGVLPEAGAGLRVEIKGEWNYHDEYGPQIAALSSRPLPFGTEAEIKAYLASGVISGLGSMTASALVSQFGTDVFTIAAEQPERLAECKSLRPAITTELVELACELMDYTSLPPEFSPDMEKFFAETSISDVPFGIGPAFNSILASDMTTPLSGNSSSSPFDAVFERS